MTKITGCDRAEAAAKAVLDHLDDLSGFDHWWGGIDRVIQRGIRDDLAKVIEKAARISATRAVLADRERELLTLKGPCSTAACRLHYAHSGPCDIKPVAASTEFIGAAE
jgi:hypothetical protein